VVYLSSASQMSGWCLNNATRDPCQFIIQQPCCILGSRLAQVAALRLVLWRCLG
jgi:hypothetical protein